MNHLADATIRLLGSTQVITSVYSVVKELIENSLDAKATSIEVKLVNFGLDKIEVRDNGCGIQTADVPFLAKRHFTSKITSFSDLETLNSYGFRGEAVASLCSVSEVLVTTKTASDDVSLTYVINNEGDITSTTPSHVGQGTTVCAKDLFKHLPVRKQYHSMVKKKKEDVKNVENLLLAYAVVQPKVRFTLFHDKKMVWQKLPTDSAASALQSILGKGVMSQMEWKRHTDDHKMEFELCVPKPGSDVSAVSRSTSDRSFLCINDRPVAVKDIEKLIRQYYCNCHACETSRYPIFYLRINLPTKDLDVNIDPNKTTVFATCMDVLLEKLEEMVLYIYGPLDEAPSWRYRDPDDGKDKQKSVSNVDAASSARLQCFKTGSSGQGIRAGVNSEDSNSGGEVASSNSVLGKETVQPSTSSVSDNDVEQKLASATSSHSPSDDSRSHHSVRFLSEENKSLHDPNRAFKTLDAGDNSLAVLKAGDLKTQQGEQLKDLQMVDQPDNSKLCKYGPEVNGVRGMSTSSQQESEEKGMTCKSSDTTEELGKTNDKEMTQPAQNDPGVGLSSWNRGTSVRSGDGAVAQPVRLFAPSPIHMPGKRPLSPTSDQEIQKEAGPPRKRKVGRAQTIMYDVVNNMAVKRPMSAKTFFLKERRPAVVEQNPTADYEEITDILTTMWDQLPQDELITFREMCWNDTQRYNKEVAEQTKVQEKTKPSGSSKGKVLNVRDMVVVASTQPLPRKPLRPAALSPARVEEKIVFSMDLLREGISRSHLASGQTYFKKTQVVARLPECGVWVCGKGSELCLLNAHRLAEVLVYHQLVKQHRLPVHHCQPVPLTPRNTSGCMSVLERMTESSQSLDTFVHLSECRLTHNGFDVKCWKDGDGQFCAELVGVCGDIPTYDVSDLAEVLAAVSAKPTLTLAESRPLKVNNYLKGEAVRMVRKQGAEKTKEEVQDMLDKGLSILSTENMCLHDRPIFHTLLTDIPCAFPEVEEDFSETLLATADSEAVDDGCDHDKDPGLSGDLDDMLTDWI